MKRALVVSGGGSRGSFAIGVLDVLLNRGIDYDILCGISVGALIVPAVAQGNFDRLKEIWFSIRGNDDVYRWKPFWFLRLPWLRGFFDFTPLWEKIDALLNVEALRKSSKKVYVGYVDLNTGYLEYVDQSFPEFKKAVFASASMPLFADPVKIWRHSAVDGGIVDVVPLKRAIEAGADEIDLILCSSRYIAEAGEGLDNILKVGLRSFEIMMNEIFKNDIEHLILINDILREKGSYRNYRYVKLNIFEPGKRISDTLELNPVKIREGFRYGREVAIRETRLW